MSCWDFATRAWERPGVAALALTLQNDHGQSVALLLWTLWTVRDRRLAGAIELAAGVRLAGDWEDRIIAPLRGVRQRLTAPLWPADSETLPLRARALAAELAAERALIEALEALTPIHAPGPGAEGVLEREGALERLATVARLWRSPAPAATLAELAAAVAD
jgi:uncharacterized protein (TIGR02444 family)